MKHIFIINPRAGKENASTKVRAFLKTRTDLESLVFNTEFQGHETELTARLCDIFDDEKIRIYACGGSGTLCRILSGIPNLANVEVACYPCGMTNDFLKVFENDAEGFRDLNALVDGKVMPIDLYDFEFGRALNSTSSGYEAKISSDVNDLAALSIVGQKLPYYLGIFKNLFTKIRTPFSIKVDGQEYNGNYTVVSSLNGICYGGTFRPLPNLCPSSGNMAVLLYTPTSVLKMVRNMASYKAGNLEPLGDSIRVIYANEMEVTVPQNLKHYFAVDGEVFDTKPYGNKYHLKLLPGALNFVVPKNVQLKEQCRGGEETC